MYLTQDCRYFSDGILILKCTVFCQALSILCLCVKKFKNCHRLTLKSLFTHHHPPPTRKLFLVSNERYGKNKTFLLRWYGFDFAPIKRYRPFCFLWLYIRRQRFCLCDHSQLSVYMSVLLSFGCSVCLFLFLSFCLLDLCLYVSPYTRVFSGGVQTNKMFQLVSQCHYPTFCPLIPKLCSVKSEH